MRYKYLRVLAIVSLSIFAACGGNQSKTTEQTTVKSANEVSNVPEKTEQVTGPVAGTIMTKEYVYQVGKQMYFWGWPMVNMHNRVLVMRQVPEPGLNGGAVPVAPVGQLCMLADYITPAERYVACPNQDVVYGFGIAMLNESPVIVQVPDFGDRFWMVQMVNQRTDGIGGLGAMYGSKSGFYMIVGPDWKGDVPQGITKVFRSNTNMAVVIPRAFMNNTPEDKAAVQPLINQVVMYPVAQFDGKMKTKDWTKVPSFPDTHKSGGGQEVAFVIPEKFFDELPMVMKEIPPLKGEEALYGWYQSVLDAASKNQELKDVLVKAAKDAEKELIEPFRQFKNVGIPVGNHWNTTKNGAAFGTDYLSRTAAARANIFVNQPVETIYYNQDFDGDGKELNGRRTDYTITFTKETLPAVKGFWSLTVYDEHHFFYQNSEKIYSLGTKNKDLKFNADGSLTIYLQNKKPEGDKASNWLPVPSDKFGFLLRAYWPEESMVKGYTPPAVVKSK